MKTLNHFFFSRGAVRVLALALIAQLVFAIAGLNSAMAQTVANGTTKDCSWEITGPSGNYTLTITKTSGTGAMADYSTNPPWYSHRDDIKTLVIQEDVTHIGNRAFQNCSNITGALTIPNSVETIGQYAFAGCSSFSGALTIGTSVKSIGTRAFHNCSGFTGTLTIGTSVETIETYAFRNCSGFTEALIPASVTTIDDAFSMCNSLTSFTVDGSNPAYSDDGGVLFNKTQTTLIQYPAGNTGTSYTVPTGVTSIAYNAFSNCTDLKSVDIPASVNTIGIYAFENCTGLTDITLNSATPPTLGTDVFDGVTLSDITLHLPAGSEAAYAGWTGFGSTRIAIPSSTLEWELSGGTLTVSGTGTMPSFYNASEQPWDSHRNDITSVVIESGVTRIGDKAFADCSNLASVDIPASVDGIGMSAFENCSALASITVDGNNTVYSSDATGVLFNKVQTRLIQYPAGNTGNSYTIPSTVSTINDYAFAGCSNLTGITVSRATPPAINTSVFSNVNRSNITLHLSAGAGGIAYQAAGWTGFGTYDMQPCPTPTEINTSGVYWQLCNDGTLTISGNGELKGIGSSFDGSTLRAIMPWTVCRQEITSVIITQGITSIVDYAFAGCTGLTNITVDWTSSPPTIDNATVFENVNKGSITLHLPAGATQGDYEAAGWSGFNYDVPTCSGPATLSGLVTWELCSNGTLTISGSGSMPNFSNASYQPWALNRSTITTVTIAPGVTGIGDYAFAECSALASVTIPEGVGTIGMRAFIMCGALETVSIPSSVSVIGLRAFSGCTALESVSIPAGVSTIGNWAFENCTGLTGITVNWTTPVDIKNKDVFSGVTPGNVTLHIAGGTGKSDYTAKGWPDGFCYSGTFGASNGLTWTLCGGTLTVEGTEDMDDFLGASGQPWYSNRDDITDVIIMGGVTAIGESAFDGCENLVSVTIPEGVTSIGMEAFSGCIKLESISIPASVGTLGQAAFAGCDLLETVNFVSPSSLTVIGTSVFQGCDALTSITIPASVTVIRAYAFWNSGLQSVIFESPSLLTTIESVSFQNCSDLTSIDIPASVTAIGTEAFKNSGLTTVTVNWTAGAIPTINANVFDGLDLSHMTLNVPTGTEDDYKAVSVWQDFGAIQFVATLTLSQAALSFTTAAGSETVNVTSNITWTAVSSDVSWLNVTPPASGTGNGSFMLTVTAHTGSSARTGTVTVSDGGSLAQAVTVTQAGVSAPPPPSPPSPPVLHRHVTLRIEGSVVSQPAPGIYDIISGENFIFTLTPPSGKVPVVQTGRTVDGGPETLTGTPNADGSYTFVVQQIREDLTLAVTFVTGTADVPAPQVWLSGRVLHVRTAPAGPLALYAVSGALVLRLDKPSGDAEFDLSALPRGLYILRAATGRTVKIQIQ